MKKCRYASVTGVMALLVALGTGVEAKNKTKTDMVETVFVRATEYDKDDLNCDLNTKSGKTSTKLRLPQDEHVVTNPDIMGYVAVDTDLFSDGGLAYEIQTRRLFVITRGGTDVIDRTAAKETAKKGNLSQEFQDAAVFDFYYPEPIIKNEWTHCWVIPHQGEKEFWRLNKESQERRLRPEFWLPILQSRYDSINDEVQKGMLLVIMDRLKEMK